MLCKATGLYTLSFPCRAPSFRWACEITARFLSANFQISLVGVLGHIHVHSPTATVCIQRMECGEERQVQVQSPVTRLALPCSAGRFPE